MGDPFAPVGDHDHARGGRGNDLFPQQRAAAALDQAEIGPDLVGAVDGQIELRRFIERGQRDAAALGIGAGRLRRRHRNDVEAGPHAFADQLDEMLRGRAGAKPEPHAGTHEFDGASSGCAFLGFGVHS